MAATVTTCSAPCTYAQDGTCSLECIDMDDCGDCRQYEEAEEVA